jgi:UDP-glucose 4-epimerase
MTEAPAPPRVRSRRRTPRKTVLVTGAAGALAGHVMARLQTLNYQVIAVDFRQKVETSAGIPSYRVELHKRGFEDIFAAHRIDSIIHLGRIFAHEKDRQKRYNANVTGTQRLLDLGRKYGATQVLFNSTYFVYGASPFNPAKLSEDAPLKASQLTQALIDSVEAESLINIHLWKHPELNITILRPVNVLGPGVRNSLSLLLSRPVVPVLAGFSPIMQFLHVEDLAEAVMLAFTGNKRGVYNVAPEDWAPYQAAVRECGCRRLPLPSWPPSLAVALSQVLSWGTFFPPYLIDYLKYPVVLDGQLFSKTFDWKPRRNLNDIFSHYRRQKAAMNGAR